MNVKIAVDFDGTIVEHAYPKIGKEKLFAFQTLRELQKEGALLILWTFRSGKELDEAIAYCRKNGVEFYAVNKNFPEEVFDASTSRKLNVDIYIDDKNIGGIPGWGEIWQMLVSDRQLQNEKKTFSRNIFKRCIFDKKKDENKL